MQTTEYLYGIDPKVLANMPYKQALDFKLTSAKQLKRELYIPDMYNRDETRFNAVAKAEKFTEKQILELKHIPEGKKMKRHIHYGSTDQFRHVVKDIIHDAQFVSGDKETGESVMDYSITLPVITFHGTEKIHGTNAAVCYTESEGFWVQSKDRIIVPGKDSDNMGCASAACANQEHWIRLITELAEAHDVDLKDNIITMYYEWAGGNTQTVSALTGLEKQAILFPHFKVTPLAPEYDASGKEVGHKCYPTETPAGAVEAPEFGIRNSLSFPTKEITVDFSNITEATNALLELIAAVEESSPAGEALGVKGNTGEGYVFTATYNGKLLRFKVKGEKHAKGAGKVKTLSPVDLEAEQLKIDFVNNVACISWRLDQMFTELQAEFGEVTVKHTGDFISKMMKDIVKEESDLMEEAGLTSKAINGKVAVVAKGYFNSRI